MGGCIEMEMNLLVVTEDGNEHQSGNVKLEARVVQAVIESSKYEAM